MIKKNFEELNTRDKILKATRDLLWVHGYNGTTTKMIAEKAGVNEVTIFRIYNNKKNILTEVLKNFSQKDSPIHAFLEKDFQDLEDFVEQLGRNAVEEISKMKEILFICIKEAGEDNPELTQIVSRTLATDTKTIAKKMMSFNINNVEERDLEVFAFMFLNTIITGAMLSLIMGEDDFPCNLQELNEKAKKLLLHGLCGI